MSLTTYRPEVLLLSWGEKPANLVLPLQSALSQANATLTTVEEYELNERLSDLENPTVVAAIVVVSQRALEQDSFSITLTSCMRVMTRRDFRLFVFLQGLDAKKLKAQTQFISVIGELFDSVHIPEHIDNTQAIELVKAVQEHLSAVPEIRDYLRFTSWKRFGLRLMQIIDFAWEILPGVALLYTLYQGPKNVLHLIVEEQPNQWLPWVLLLLGTYLYKAVLGILSLRSPSGEGSRYLMFGHISLPFLALIFTPLRYLAIYWPFLIVGLGYGFLIDSARRLKAREDRKNILLQTRDCADADRLYFQEQLRPLPSWLPKYVPAIGVRASVFISYSRQSAWGREAACQFREELKKWKIPCFLDVQDIVAGTSFRHRLKDQLGEASVLVAFQDEVTAPRDWPATEIRTACFSQLRCGLPYIIIIHPPAFTNSNLPPQTPALLASAWNADFIPDPNFLEVIEYDKNTLSDLAKGLRYHWSMSLINSKISAIIYVVTTPIRISLVFIGGLCGISWLCVIAWILFLQNGIEPNTWLQERGIHFLVTILFSYWFSFALRYALAFRFESHYQRVGFSIWLSYLIAVALLIVVTGLVWGGAVLTWLYAGLVAGIAFALAGEAATVSFKRRDVYKNPRM